MAGLTLLGEYGSDSSESENSECESSISSSNRVQRPLTTGSWAISEQEPPSKMMKLLPLPSALLGPSEAPKDVQDDPNLHQGRIRSFPHVKGNWATYVYVSGLEGVLSDIELLQKDLQRVCAALPIPLNPVQDPHLSLSRVVTVKYDWIQPLMSSLKSSLAPFPRFKVQFQDIVLLLNEEKTRTFIGLGLDQSSRILRDLVAVIDANLAEFDLPPFYVQPKFHISLFWALGDQTLALKARLPALRATFIRWLGTLASREWQVSQLQSKSGHKIFTFPLGAS